MIILGIDPGTATTGFGVIETTGRTNKMIATGQISTSKMDKFECRLRQIEEDIMSLIKTYKPDAASVEQIFFQKNLKTAIQVSHARGVIIVCLAKMNVPIYEYTPLQVKQGMTGYGKASKKEVQEMVKLELKLNKIPKPDDAADALAMAIICASEISKQR